MEKLIISGFLLLTFDCAYQYQTEKLDTFILAVYYKARNKFIIRHIDS